MITGLDNHHFHRSGGPENQGSGAPLKDYVPSGKEVHEYWKTLLAFLKPIAKKETSNGELARKEFTRNVRILIRDGFLDEIENFIREVIIAFKGTWPDLTNALRRAIAYEVKGISVLETRIESIIELLSPKDLRSELMLKVSKPEWFDHAEDINGDQPAKNATALAEKIVQDNIDISEFLPDLLTGEQRQSFNFGKRLGELMPDKNGFIIKGLSALDTIPFNQQSPELLAGFAIGTKDDQLISELYTSVLNSNTYMHTAFYFARALDMKIPDLYRLFDLVDNNKVNIGYFLNFKYGGFFSNTSAEEVIEFCRKINSYSEGNWVALTLLYMYCFNNEGNWQSCSAAMKDIITKENMVVNKNIAFQMDDYHWASTVEKLLLMESDNEFALTIMKQLIDIGSERDYSYSIDSYLPKIYRILFDKYFDQTWPVFGNALLEKNYIFIIHINHTIGAQKGSHESVGVLFENPERFEKLIAWCKEHPEEGPKRMAHMMPIEAGSSENIEWHPFAKMIIDNFGANKEVISNLSANIGTYGSVGSSVPYLQSVFWLMQLLKDHPIDLVRQWSVSEANSLRKQIKHEELDNEEQLPRI